MLPFCSTSFLPGSSALSHSGQAQPQSLSQILKTIRRSGQVPGRPLVLAADASSMPLMAVKDVLVPISRQTCGSETASCQSLTELRVYRSLQLPYLLRLFQSTHYYRLLDHSVVEGPVASRLNIQARRPRRLTHSQQPLPLTRIERYHPAPQPGVWLQLSGLRPEGNTTTTYGQILYFHRHQARLQLILNWASPTGESPAWQQVTGDGQPELVVNQSVGLDPQFAVYQLKTASSGASQVYAISLAEPVFAEG